MIEEDCSLDCKCMYAIAEGSVGPLVSVVYQVGTGLAVLP